MSRLPSVVSFFALAALGAATAPPARAADDPAKVAADAQKQLGDVRKQLAGGTDLLKRLRVDKFEAGEGAVKVEGVFLDAPAREKEASPFDRVSDELTKALRERFQAPDLKVDTTAVVRVPADKHPHVVVQLAANKAGETDPLADRVRCAGSHFAADGAVVLTGTRGKDEAVAGWLAAAIPAALGKNPAVLTKGLKPLVIDDLKPVEWKLTPAGIQNVLAASPEVATRRVRVDRAYLTYEIPKSDDAVGAPELRFVVTSIRLGEDKLEADAVQAACTRLWPEVLGGANRIPVTAPPGPSVADPTARAQPLVARRPALDGVRVETGAEFGPAGELALAGVQPGLSADGRAELAAAVQGVLKELIDKGDAAADLYRRLAASPVSARNMKLVATPKLLADLRAWAAADADDVKLARLYFDADAGLKLQARTASKADGDRVGAKFKGLVPAYLPADPLAADKFPEPAVEATLFPASLTARLRAEMAGDQKKWNGVLIERGYFDAGGRYTVRGVVDAAGQNDGLAALLETLAADGTQYGDYFTPAPSKPALAVIPMSELVERVKRVTPAYPVFDGVRVEGARYDADVNLIFDARVVGTPDPAAEARLAELIRADPKYRRRAPAGKQVLIRRADGPKYSDDQLADFSLAFGAKLLAKAGGGAADRAKAKEWLDTATLHYPNESAVWFLDAYYQFAIAKDAELARRDLYRTIEAEGTLAFNGPSQRKRRYEAAKDPQGPVRSDLEALWLECFREVKDGARPLTLTPPVGK
jgi:hypothetical protein